MTRTSEILDQIGAAVDDWEVSQDAMRQAPDLEPPVLDLQAPTLASLEGIARIIARGGRVEYRHEPEPIRFNFCVNVQPFTDAMRQMAVALVRVDWPQLRAALTGPGAARPVDLEFSRPRPLCIDGHAYHHRTRARRRRR
jgi:hypothetical protein